MALLLHLRRTGPGQQGLGRTRHLWILLAVLAAVFFLSHPTGAEPTKEVRRILILNEVGTSYPGIAIINEGIQAALNDSPHLEFYSEYMDTGLFPDPAEQQGIRDFYLRKYQKRKPDVIITVGPSPLKFMEEVHQRAFAGVPIVFCLPVAGAPGAPVLDSDFTGVENDMAPAKTLKVALRLQPGTEHVVVVNGGIANFDKQELASVKAELNAFRDHLDITYLTKLAMPDLLERLRQLPAHTLILLSTVSLDAAGRRFKGNETGQLVATAANAPVFSLFDVYLNHGEVGGYLSSLREQGKVAGTMALRLLSGAKPQDIPRVNGVNTYMFDWRALKRWGLRESDLPPGSVVLFREISVWERTKRLWISGLLIILALSLLATYLQYSRAELKKSRDAQLQLGGQLINAQETERSRLASELHDDFSQRLALLAFGLQNTAETLPDSSGTAKQTLDEFRQSVCELGDDLHSVSHRLHSSTLDTLGLVAGLSSLCREFGAKQGIEVAFASEDIPRTVRPEVSLCLFRITQEGLQNLKKHSGTKTAQLSLRHMGEKLFLSLCDEGIGFDANGLEKHGLGILSMQGRARLLGGEFEIHSKPGKGTRIDVWVPLQPVADRLNV
jgi:signal transduction histidine kinase